MPDSNSRLLSPAEVAAMVSVDPKTVTRWAHEGRLKTACITPGGHRRYLEADVRAMTRPPAAPERPPGAPSAVLRIGGGLGIALYLTPAAGDSAPGQAVTILGKTGAGNPVTLTVTSREWLEDLNTVICDRHDAFIPAAADLAPLAVTP